jgi:2-polyprenyl-3-methyl-5-hydroxy-6-metoxy-1,4-benzoquinol methylase
LAGAGWKSRPNRLGQVLAGFAAWCQPQPGWLALDIGCRPGLLPALLAQRGCRAYGADLDGALSSPTICTPQI